MTTIPFLVPPLKLLMQFPLSYVSAALEVRVWCI